MTRRERAEAFLEMLYKQIEHGDAKHRAWLREQLMHNVATLEWLLENR